MGNFRSGGDRGGRPSFGGGRSSGGSRFSGGDRGGSRFGGGDRGGSRFGGGDRDRERVVMHDAVCDECGKSCQVPFKPSSDKPIYCSDCFGKRNASESGDRRGGRSSFGGDRNDDREMFSVKCDECGKDCEVPFKPSGDKPVYCSDCFRKDGRSDNRDSRGSSFSRGGDSRGNDSRSNDSGMKEQLVALNEKLDRVLRALELRVKIGPSTKMPLTAKPEAKKVVKAVAPAAKVAEKKAPAKAVVAKPAAKPAPAKKVVAVKKPAASTTKKKVVKKAK